MLKNAIAIPAGLVAVVSFRVYVSARLFSVAVVSSLRGASFLELVMPLSSATADAPHFTLLPAACSIWGLRRMVRLGVALLCET